MHALGVLDLDSTHDPESARRGLRRTAESHDLDLIDTLTFHPQEPGWIFRVLESIHRLRIHAVIVRDITDLHGLHRAITGVADLHSARESMPYLGYGAGHLRPSADTGRAR